MAEKTQRLTEDFRGMKETASKDLDAFFADIRGRLEELTKTQAGLEARSDKLGRGFNESLKTDRHRYLRIKGGFLLVIVERADGKPTITFRHYGTDGAIYHEDNFPPR